MLGDCYSSCLKCLQPSNPFACLACPSSFPNPYFLSCQNTASFDPNSIIFIISVICLVVLMVQYFLLLLNGVGFYREAYENLQLIMLVNWGFQFQDNANVLEWSNLGQVQYDFPSSALPQMIVVWILLAAFFIVGIAVQGRSTGAFAVMFRRKRIIFPFRIYTFFFNFFTTCTCMQLIYLTYKIDNSPASAVQAFLCLIFLLIGFIGIVLKLNFSSAALDDPRFYPLTEKQTSQKRRVKNQIVFSLITRAAVIASFSASFSKPLTAQILMLCFQGIYTLYYTIFIRLSKIRYTALNLLSNYLVLGQLATTTQFAKTFPSSSPAIQLSWLIILILYIVVLITALFVEQVSTWMQLKRQLRSVYVRFVLCEKEEQELTLNQYDEGFNKQRVTEFVDNPLRSKVRPLVLDDGL